MSSTRSSIDVPYGWKRSIEQDSKNAFVLYMSPSGIVLSSIAEVCQYLEKDDTCKCGLKCPILVPKVFSFNPEIASKEIKACELAKDDILNSKCHRWKSLTNYYISKCISPKRVKKVKQPSEVPPPKLIIRRKGGRLMSVIPDTPSPNKEKKIGDKVCTPPCTLSTQTTVNVPPEVSQTNFKLQWFAGEDDAIVNEGFNFENVNDGSLQSFSKNETVPFPAASVVCCTTHPSLQNQNPIYPDTSMRVVQNKAMKMEHRFADNAMEQSAYPLPTLSSNTLSKARVLGDNWNIACDSVAHYTPSRGIAPVTDMSQDMYRHEQYQQEKVSPMGRPLSRSSIHSVPSPIPPPIPQHWNRNYPYNENINYQNWGNNFNPAMHQNHPLQNPAVHHNQWQHHHHGMHRGGHSSFNQNSNMRHIQTNIGMNPAHRQPLPNVRTGFSNVNNNMMTITGNTIQMLPQHRLNNPQEILYNTNYQKHGFNQVPEYNAYPISNQQNVHNMQTQSTNMDHLKQEPIQNFPQNPQENVGFHEHNSWSYVNKPAMDATQQSADYNEQSFNPKTRKQTKSKKIPKPKVQCASLSKSALDILDTLSEKCRNDTLAADALRDNSMLQITSVAETLPIYESQPIEDSVCKPLELKTKICSPIRESPNIVETNAEIKKIMHTAPGISNETTDKQDKITTPTFSDEEVFSFSENIEDRSTDLDYDFPETSIKCLLTFSQSDPTSSKLISNHVSQPLSLGNSVIDNVLPNRKRTISQCTFDTSNPQHAKVQRTHSVPTYKETESTNQNLDSNKILTNSWFETTHVNKDTDEETPTLSAKENRKKTTSFNDSNMAENKRTVQQNKLTVLSKKNEAHQELNVSTNIKHHPDAMPVKENINLDSSNYIVNHVRHDVKSNINLPTNKDGGKLDKQFVKNPQTDVNKNVLGTEHFEDPLKSKETYSKDINHNDIIQTNNNENIDEALSNDNLLPDDEIHTTSCVATPIEKNFVDTSAVKITDQESKPIETEIAAEQIDEVKKEDGANVIEQLVKIISKNQNEDDSKMTVSNTFNTEMSNNPQLKDMIQQCLHLQNEILEKVNNIQQQQDGPPTSSNACSTSTQPVSPQGLQVPIVSSSVKSGDKTGVESPTSIVESGNIEFDAVEHDEVLPEEDIITRRLRSKNPQKQTSDICSESCDKPKTKKSIEPRDKPVNLRNKAAPVPGVDRDPPLKSVKPGDLIWGQMRGYPSWPGKIVRASEVRCIQQRIPLVDGKVWVKWFGDHTFAQMNPQDFKSMTEGLEMYTKTKKKCRTRNKKISNRLEYAIQEAVDELEKQQIKQANKKNLSKPVKSKNR